MRGAVFIATSVDGFIARPGGQVDFLESGDPWPADLEPSDFGYQAFMDSVDCLIMGRKSFEAVLGFDVEWPYGDKPVIVMSGSGVRIPDEIAATVESSSLSAPELAVELGGRGFERAYVDGGVTIRGFLRSGLIDEMVITTIPVLIGEGIPLFGSLSGDVPLHHVETITFANGLVQNRYSIRRPGSEPPVP